MGAVPRWRPVLGELVFWVLLFAPTLAIAILGSWLFPIWVSLRIALGLCALDGTFSLFIALDTDDWWNDFRGQNLILILGPLGSAFFPALGVFLGTLAEATS